MGMQSSLGTDHIPLKNRIGYGVGDLASNIIFTGFSFFLVYFYTDIVSIPVAIVGTVMLVSRIFDGVTDIIMGIVVDRTKSRFGKARPWLLWMAILFGISVITMPRKKFVIEPTRKTHNKRVLVCNFVLQPIA